jgi:hypothetical protein
MKLNPAQIEAIEVADANLNNADLPLYSVLVAENFNLSKMAGLSVKVEVRSVYGNEAIYPVCFYAARFAGIAGKKTLSRTDLMNIKALGFTVEEVSIKKLAT